jgi:excisionase family DNA binding protein
MSYGQKVVPLQSGGQSSASIFGEAFMEAIKSAVREVIREETGASSSPAIALLTPEQLAERLQIPVSWVYEQSRQGNIPTHRLGRYIRFDLSEVLESQKKRSS